MTLEDINFLNEGSISAPDHEENLVIYFNEISAITPDIGYEDILANHLYLGFVSGYDIYIILPSTLMAGIETSELKILRYSLSASHVSSPSSLGLYGFKDGKMFLLEDLVYGNKLDVDYLFQRILPRVFEEGSMFSDDYTLLNTPFHYYEFVNYYKSRINQWIFAADTRFYYLGSYNDYALYLILPDVAYDSSLEKNTFKEYAYVLNYPETTSIQDYDILVGRYNTVFISKQLTDFVLKTPITGTVSDFNMYGYKDGEFFTIQQLLAPNKIDIPWFFHEILPTEFGGKRDYYYNSW